MLQNSLVKSCPNQSIVNKKIPKAFLFLMLMQKGSSWSRIISYCPKIMKSFCLKLMYKLISMVTLFGIPQSSSPGFSLLYPTCDDNLPLKSLSTQRAARAVFCVFTGARAMRRFISFLQFAIPCLFQFCFSADCF